MKSEAAARKRAAVETYARNEATFRRTARRYSFCEDDADEALQRALEAERREAIARSREALQALKPQELRALTLLAEGYSYAEIGEITSWSRTKINRCLAEGRERFRNLVSRSEDGRRCAEMRPLISAFCDGEASPGEVTELREHLRACGSCRATLRTYRAAPAAAAALAPALAIHRSLLERVRDAFAELAGRFGSGRGDTALSHVAGGSGAGGFGIAAAAKVAAVCIGTAGGAAACAAAGLVPAPLDLGTEKAKPGALERRLDAPERETTQVEYEPAPVPVPPEPKTESHPAPAHHQPASEAAPASAEPAPETGEPASSSGAVEYSPPPAPEPAPVSEPAPVASSEGGDPAGEFGP